MIAVLKQIKVKVTRIQSHRFKAFRFLVPSCLPSDALLYAVADSGNLPEIQYNMFSRYRNISWHIPAQLPAIPYPRQIALDHREWPIRPGPNFSTEKRPSTYPSYR